MSQQNQTDQPDLDTQALSDFIYELNISRRHLATYPPDHPMISSSIEKVSALLNDLFVFRKTLTLGIAKDAIRFEQNWLDKKNPVFRDFATALAKLGIAAIHLHCRPSGGELVRFNQLLRSDRQQIADRGGFSALLQQMQIDHILIDEIDYSAFHASDEEKLTVGGQAEPLWQDFIDGLLSDSRVPDAAEHHPLDKFDPKIVAEILNHTFADRGDNHEPDYERVISSFVSKIPGTDQQNLLSTEYGQLVSQLNPELKRQFLNSTLRHLDNGKEGSQAVLEKFPTELLLSSLEAANQQQLNISGTMLNLLGTLSQQQSDPLQSLTSNRVAPRESDVEQQLRTIFQEEDNAKFTPEAYQQALNSILSLDQQLQLPAHEITELRQQLEELSLERHTSAIIFRLMADNQDRSQFTGLQQNLIDLANYFVETGDFKGLYELHGSLLSYLHNHPDDPPEATAELLETLHNPEFQQEILDNLQRWDEDKQTEIRTYIKLAGEGFAKTLIQRLATEPDRTLRRFHLNTLVSMGSSAHQQIYTALTDKRWYLVRNLVAVLRIQKAEIDLKMIHPLKDHPHLRVNQEVLKLLLQQDPGTANQLLLKQLDSDEPEICQQAIRLAEQSSDQTIFNKLLVLLERDRLNHETLPLKLQIVKSLGIIGAESALPVLSKQLFAGKLFRSSRQQQLQIEILNHLDHYPFSAVKQLLQKLILARRGELSRLATEKLRELLRSRDES